MSLALEPEQLYRRYGPMIFRRCLQLLGQHQEALDALQDVFVLILRQRDRIKLAAPSALLNRISTNVCLNRLRGRKRSEEPVASALEVIAQTPDPESATLAGRIVSRLFRDELASTRTIAVLHYVDGMTHEEVALEVGLSVSGVRKRLRTFQSRLTSLPEVL
ncbi:MAG: RNA polymerase sigma factor [Myxococcaceae bacterium]